MVAVEDLDDVADVRQPGLLSAYNAGPALEAARLESALPSSSVSPSTHTVTAEPRKAGNRACPPETDRSAASCQYLSLYSRYQLPVRI